MEKLPGPDFPTAGIINGIAGIRDAYATGRGKIYVRARAEYEPENDRIVISELPYQVNTIQASMVSPRLWGGMLVAIPTAIPVEPLTSRLGTRVGSTTGSVSLPS